MSILNPNKELNEKIENFINDLEIVISGMHNEIQTSKSELNQYFNDLKKVTEKYTNETNIRKIDHFLNYYDELNIKIKQIGEKITSNQIEISLLSANQLEQNKLLLEKIKTINYLISSNENLFLKKIENINLMISNNERLLKNEIEKIKVQNDKLHEKVRKQNIMFLIISILLFTIIIYPYL